MSTNSELRARLARLGPIRDADPPPLFSGDLIPLVLKLVGVLDKPISAIKRLREAGLTLRDAHAIINRLAETRFAVCRIAEGADIPALAADLATMNVNTNRHRCMEPGLIAEVRTRHGFTQQEFAELLGLDIDTLQNWEEGRDCPDPVALRLVMAFDKAPGVVADSGLEPVV